MKTFMALRHNFNAHLGVFRQNSVLLSVHLIPLNKKRVLKCFCDLFEIKDTIFVPSARRAQGTMLSSIRVRP